MPRKVLVITYYWPPAGGIAVQRWVKFCKYLGEYGWQPIVYTVSNGHYQLIDASMLKDVADDLVVLKRPIWEPYELYRLFSKNKTGNINSDEIKPGGSTSWIKKLSVWVRGNFFIPDARKFWIRPSIQFLCDYIKDNPVDAVISTGPPHSTHLIALGLKKKINIPWLADFRDPWTTIYYFKELLLTKRADRKHHRLEKEVLTLADSVTVVGRGMKNEFEQKREKEVMIVTNGFDEADFESEKVETSNEFSLIHIGTLFVGFNPTGVWKALSELKKEEHPLFQKLKIKLTGKVVPSIIDDIKANGLENFLILTPFVPHDEAIRQMRSASVLLLSVYEENKEIITGKLFEYLAAQRPILFTGAKDGDAAKIILDTEAGSVFSLNEVEPIKMHIAFLFDQFEKGELHLRPNQSQKYSHRFLAKQIAEELNRITKV